MPEGRTPADHWDTQYEQDVFVPPSWPDKTMVRWLDYIGQDNPPPGRILEVGYGAGRNLMGIQAYAGQVQLVLSYAERRYKSLSCMNEVQ